MKRWLTTIVAVLVCSSVLRADITIVQTTTVEGGMASMAASAGGGGPVTPKMTTQIKGMKSRSDIEAGPNTVATIIDLNSKEVIVLRPDQKTATMVSPVPRAATTPPAAGAPPAPGTAVAVDVTVTPTGKSQVLDGLKCDEYTFTTRMNMGEVSGRQLPPEALQMMQGVMMVMQGSMWVAKDVPGAAEYLAFQKASATGALGEAAMTAAGVSVPGMEKLTKAMASVQGLPYLTEMTINIEGTGQIAEMMKQMGAMKVTTRVNSIKTDALSDNLFKVPEGYSVVKQQGRE